MIRLARVLTTILLICGCAVNSPRLVAAETPSHALPEFRRVLAPADRIQDWPIPPGVKYIPIEQEEFERLAQGKRTDESRAAMGNELISSEYTASWSPGGDLFGSLQWKFHRGAVGSLISLGTVAGEIHNPRWDNVEGAAVLGRDKDAQLWLQRSTGNTLLANWSQSPCHDDEQNEFEFSAPDCAGSVLTLTAPRNYVVETGPALQLESAEPADTGVRYRYRFAHADRVWIRMRVASEPFVSRGLDSRVSQECTVSATAVDITANVQLWCFDDRQSNLRIYLDEGVELVSAYADKEPLAWGVEPADRGGTVAQFHWAPRASQKPVPLQLRAVATRPQGKPWFLPQIRPLGTGFVPGSARVVFSEAWEVQGVSTQDATQLSFAATAQPATETYSFALFNRDSTVQLECSRHVPPPDFTQSAQLKVSEDRIDARLIVQLEPESGLQPRLRGRVEDPWQIEAVELLDADLPIDWTVEEDGNQTPQLVLRLPSGAMSAEGARVLITAFRGFASGQGLDAKDLRIVRFSPGPKERALAAVTAPPTQEVHLSTEAQSALIKTGELTSEEIAIFGGMPDGYTFRVPARDADVRIRFATRSGQNCPVDLHTDVAISEGLLKETCRVHCVPTLEGTTHVQVRTTKVDTETWHWQLEEPDGGSELSISKSEDVNHASESTETIWDFRLDQPRDQPFFIVGRRVSPAGEESRVSLPRGGENAPQASTIFLFAEEGDDLRVRSSGMTRLPDGESRAKTLVRRAVYSYDAPREAHKNPVLAVIKNFGAAPLPDAWVWQAQLTSTLTASGHAQHAATYLVKALKSGPLELQLPPSMTAVSVQVAGIDYAAEKFDQGQGVFRIPLEPSTNGTLVRIDYRGPQNLPRLAETIAPPWPKIPWPILAQRWTLHTPHGYSIQSPSWLASGIQRDGLELGQRLLGGLARDPRDVWQNRFWPLKFADDDHAHSLAAAELLTRSVEFEAQALAESNGPTPSWGEFLGNWQSSEVSHAVTLLLDAQGLAQVGIIPRHPWEFVSAMRRNESGHAEGRSISYSQFLQQRGLTLVISGNVALITTRRAISELEPSSTLEALRPGILLAEGTLLHQAIQQAATSDDLRFTSINAWRRLDSMPGPESETLADEARNWGPTGDTICAMVGSSATQSVWIGNHAALHAWGGLFALTAFVLIARLSSRAAIGVFCCLTALAFSVPLIWSPCTSALMLGSLLGLSWPGLRALVLRWQEQWLVLRKLPASADKGAQVVASLLLLVICCQKSECAVPQEKTRAIANLPIVFVPTDHENRPTEDRVHVPLTLYQAWLDRTGGQSSRVPDWIVAESQTSVRIGNEFIASHSGTVTETLVIHTFGANVRLAAADLRPMRSGDSRKEARLAARLLLVDGQPTQRDFGATDFVELREPGIHRVQFQSLCPVVSDLTQLGVNLPIPIAATASLELETLLNTKQVTVNGRRKGTTANPPNAGELRGAANGEWRVRFDANDKISLPDAKCDTFAFKNDADVLGPVLVRLALSQLERPEKRLSVVCDSHWLLTPSPDDPGLVTSVRPSPYESDHWTVELAEPITEQGMVMLSLVAARPGPIKSSIPIPRVVGVRPGLAWLATGGTAKDHVSDEAESKIRTQFGQHWGDESLAPDKVHVADAAALTWSLPEKENAAPIQVDGSLQVFVDEKFSAVHFAAQVSAVDQSRFQLELQVPSNLVDWEAAVEAAGESVLQRATRRTPERLTLLLKKPLAPQTQIRLSGRQHTKLDRAAELPLVQMRGGGTPLTVDVYQGPQTLIDFADAGQNREDSPDLQAGNEEFRHVARFSVTAGAAPPMITARANRPQIHGQQRLTVERTVLGWKVLSLLDLQISGGRVDRLEYSLPVDFPRSARIHAADASELAPGAPGSGPRIVTRLGAPLVASGKYELELELPKDQLELGGVPDLHPLDMEISREIILPSEADAKPLMWETRNLTLREKMDGAQPVANATTFRIEGPTFVARWVQHSQSGEKPFSWRQDCWLLATSPDGGIGYLRQDLQRLDGNPLLVQCQSGQHLIDVRIGGVRPFIRREENGELRLLTGAVGQALPLELLYSQEFGFSISPPEVHGIEFKNQQLVFGVERMTAHRDATADALTAANLDRLRSINQILAPDARWDDPAWKLTQPAWRETWRDWQWLDGAALSAAELQTDGMLFANIWSELERERSAAYARPAVARRVALAERQQRMPTPLGFSWLAGEDLAQATHMLPIDTDDRVGTRVMIAVIFLLAGIGYWNSRRQVASRSAIEIAAPLMLGLVWVTLAQLPWLALLFLFAAGAQATDMLRTQKQSS